MQLELNLARRLSGKNAILLSEENIAICASIFFISDKLGNDISFAIMRAQNIPELIYCDVLI